MKIIDQLLYVRDMKEFKELLDRVNIQFNLKHQYAIERPCGSVTEAYRDEKGHFIDTKSIIGVFSLYEQQLEAFQWLLDNEYEHKEIYSSFNESVFNELVNKYPKILEAENEFGWGSDAKNWTNFPAKREVDCSIVEVYCNSCFDEFEICCDVEYEFNGELIQCPLCKEELEVSVEYNPSFSGYKVRN